MRTSDPELHHETIDTRARPARVAVLTDTSDLDWRQTAVRIVEFLSSVWGGKHSLIIPSDGSTIDPLFWTILEKFSPDYVYFYRKTGRDVQISRPEEYAVQLESIVRRYEIEGAILEKNKEDINQARGKAWADRFALNTNLCSDIASRLVPFHHAGHFEPITGHGYVPHNLTSIVDVLSCVDHPHTFASFQVPLEIDPVWWITNTGTYSAKFAEQLSGVGLNEKAIAVSNENLGSFCDWVVGDFDRLQQATLEALGAGPEFMPPDPTCPTPFDVSMSRVGLYAPPLSHMAAVDRFALILGDSLVDFCLSYCLPRIGHRAVWLPLRWMKDIETIQDSPLRTCVSAAVYAAPSNLRRGSGLKVCSASTSVNFVVEVLEVLKRCFALGLNGEIVTVLEPTQVVAGAIDAPTPYCVDSPNQSEIYPFLGDKSVGTIRSPRPTGFSRLDATKHRWVAEVGIGRTAVPTIPHIAQNLVLLGQGLSTYDTRVSQHALAYVCPGAGLIIGDDINSNIRNPEIRLFDTLTAVSVVSRANGFSCQLSDKGIYQRDSLERLGGISEAAKLLRDHASRAVFRKFLDHTDRKRGTYDEGCVLQADKRTYLDLAAVQKLMGGEDPAVSLLDKLTAAKVTYRGFVLGCTVCKHAAWYSLAELSDEFRCVRCGREQTIRREHWRHPAAPQIFYKLDEIVYQFLKGDGDVVALSLDYMSRCSTYPFHYSSEIQFRKDDSQVGEIDLCAVWNGMLVIGEAKKQGELASTESETRKIVNKYERLATMLNARRVLFCTSSQEWKRATLDAVRRAFERKLAMPVFLAAEDLLGEKTPQD